MKIKEILQKWLINNLGYKILALVFAFVLWLVIVNIQNPNMTKTITGIPVTIINEDALSENDYKFYPTAGTTATVIVTGARSIVDPLTRNDFVATANLEELSLTYAVPITVSLSDEKARYASQLTITQQTKSMILSLDAIISENYDVNVIYAGELPENMIIESQEVTPKSIRVTGPGSVLDTIYRTEATVSLNDVEDGAVLRATPVFYNYSGDIIEFTDDIKVSADEISVTFDTSYTKTVGLAINTLGNPPSGYEVSSITWSFNQVKLKGTEEALSGISEIRLPNTLLDVRNSTKNVTVGVNLNDYLPQGVEIMDNNSTVYVTANITREETEATTEEESESEDESSTDSDETDTGETDETSESSGTESAAESEPEKEPEAENEDSSNTED